MTERSQFCWASWVGPRAADGEVGWLRTCLLRVALGLQIKDTNGRRQQPTGPGLPYDHRTGWIRVWLGFGFGKVADIHTRKMIFNILMQQKFQKKFPLLNDLTRYQPIAEWVPCSKGVRKGRTWGCFRTPPQAASRIRGRMRRRRCRARSAAAAALVSVSAKRLDGEGPGGD